MSAPKLRIMQKYTTEFSTQQKPLQGNCFLWILKGDFGVFVGETKAVSFYRQYFYCWAYGKAKWEFILRAFRCVCRRWALYQRNLNAWKIMLVEIFFSQERPKSCWKSYSSKHKHHEQGSVCISTVDVIFRGIRVGSKKERERRNKLFVCATKLLFI